MQHAKNSRAKMLPPGSQNPRWGQTNAWVTETTKTYGLNRHLAPVLAHSQHWTGENQCRKP